MDRKKKSRVKNVEPDPDDVNSELSATFDDNGPAAASKKKGKKGKKGLAVDDDEFDVPAVDDKESESGVSVDNNDAVPKKKGKKGKKGLAVDDDEFDVSALDDVKSVESSQSRDGSKKGKKGKQPNKGRDDDDDDDDFMDDLHRNAVNLTAPKKGKKATKPMASASFALLDEMDGSGDLVDGSEVDDSAPMEPEDAVKPSKQVLLNKQKSKSGNKDVKASTTEGVGSGSVEGDEDALVFSGKKKAKGKKEGKSDTFGFAALDALKDTDEPPKEDLEDDEPLVFSGKKKSKKDRPKADKESIEVPGDADVDSSKAEEVGAASKKKSKRGKKSGRTAEEEEDLDAILAELDGPKPDKQLDTDEPPKEDLEDDEPLVFSGKKKSKKDRLKADKESIAVPGDADVDSSKAEEVGAASKKKSKRGKKSGRTAQEEEDLDAILAELDGPKPDKQPEPTSLGPEASSQDASEPASATSAAPTEGVDDADAGDAVESAASKKKKKKKEKEKAKAAGKQSEQADAPIPEEKQEAPKSKVPDKKVPKHVREMQERLAKQKEIEERIRREEEERRRKEEEEQRRLEELEREKEEAKRRRKEREKEKLLKKKQEGKLLTGKQKEEARRLALMREQLLAQKGSVDVDASSREDSAPKKPKYENKKKRRPQGGESVTSTEQIMEDHEAPLPIEVDVVEKELEIEPEVAVPIEEEGVAEAEGEAEAEEEEEDEDWDAKSWDNDDIELPPVKSAFAEEEDEISAPKKTTKAVVTQTPKDAPPTKRPASPPKPAVKVARPTAPQPSTNINQESEEESESEDESDSEEEDSETKRRREAANRRANRKAEALAKRSADDLRSPICCILGHVDTGKTKLLDCIRRTNVQEGEAGGITQQIGATYFPRENIVERTKDVRTKVTMRVPGLLVIDTPGHESFTNLRSRGSGLCDIAILVVDIMHGLEPQTLESLNLLKMRHTPFVVALNKVDRLYAWKTCPNAPINDAFERQSKDVMNEFEQRLSQIVTELKEQGLNSELYYKNPDRRKYVSIVPTSAISGEGVPDLLMLLITLTQQMMESKLMYSSEVQCTVLEVKVIEGLGTTIDVILVNGVLHEGDQVVVCGMQGPIVTNIRALLTPHPMKELRVKGSYLHHKELKAAQGIKITAQGLEHAIAGTQLLVVGPEDDLDEIKVEAMKDMKNVMSRVDRSGEGVCVQASTLGSLEALLEFLKSPAVKIPVSGINIGPVHKRDVMRASVMLERKKKEYATILAFDVKVTPEAKELAEEVGVRIFTADIIYHLFDQFTAYMNNIKEEKRKGVTDEAVFPCVLGIKPEFVFNKKDPIILGVDVLEGIARIGTPICVPSQEMIDIGRIASMEVNHKVVDSAKKGQAVAMKIVGSTPEEIQKMYGRHFDHEDQLVSHITRRSIDVLKENFREELSVDEWKLLVKLKKLFNIP